MPRRDGSGPMGQGAMTGRGAGPCNTANTGATNNLNNRAYGGGFGRGMRCGNGMGVQNSWLENRLNAIEQKLNSLPEDNK